MATGGSANSSMLQADGEQPAAPAGDSEAPGTGSGSAAAPSASSQKRLQKLQPQLAERSGFRGHPEQGTAVGRRTAAAGEPALEEAVARGPVRHPRAVVDAHALARGQRRRCARSSKAASDGLSAGMTLRQMRAWPASMPPMQPASEQASAAAAAILGTAFMGRCYQRADDLARGPVALERRSRRRNASRCAPDTRLRTWCCRCWPSPAPAGSRPSARRSCRSPTGRCRRWPRRARRARGSNGRAPPPGRRRPARA